MGLMTGIFSACIMMFALVCLISSLFLWSSVRVIVVFVSGLCESKSAQTTENQY
jgi:hypothetical protein